MAYIKYISNKSIMLSIKNLFRKPHVCIVSSPLTLKKKLMCASIGSASVPLVCYGGFKSGMFIFENPIIFYPSDILIEGGIGIALSVCAGYSGFASYTLITEEFPSIIKHGTDCCRIISDMVIFSILIIIFLALFIGNAIVLYDIGKSISKKIVIDKH
jgi:hypothetical protein